MWLEPLFCLPPLLPDPSPSLSLAFGLSHTCKRCPEFSPWKQRPEPLSLLIRYERVPPRPSPSPHQEPGSLTLSLTC